MIIAYGLLFMVSMVMEISAAVNGTKVPDFQSSKIMVYLMTGIWPAAEILFSLLALIFSCSEKKKDDPKAGGRIAASIILLILSCLGFLFLILAYLVKDY